MQIIKKEKDDLSENQTELAQAFTEITEDLKMQKEQNEELRNKLKTRAKEVKPTMHLLQERSNRDPVCRTTSHNSAKKHPLGDMKAKKITDLVSDYRKENEKFVDKVNQLQQKLNFENIRS